jgi:hypothetical protein
LSLPAADPTSFGHLHFGAAQLGDRRRTRRLVHTADLIAQNPGGTLPKKLQSPAALDGLYRLADSEAVTHEAVLEPHRQLTLQKMRGCEDVVLIIQDTTMLDFTAIGSLRDQLGPIAKGRHSRGYLCHNSLALAASSRHVLGLAHQILYRRQEAPPGETRAQRRTRQERESRLWTRASRALPAAPEGKTWVEVCDRGADIFEYIDFKHLAGAHYLVRSAHNRWVKVVDADGAVRRVKLHDYARSLPAWGCKTVDIPARETQPARTAKLVLSAAAITLIPPRRKRGEHRREPLPSFVIIARESDAPAGVEPVEWILLSDLEVSTLEDVVRDLHWYGGRWTVEDYHKAMKTGCAVEALQLTTVERLQPVLALLSVVAVSLLELRDAGRTAEAQVRPATEVFSAESVAVLAGWRYGVPRTDLTLAEFCWALGRLGGHQNRRGDGPPGLLVLWRGWTELQAMLRGVAAVRLLRCGET